MVASSTIVRPPEAPLYTPLLPLIKLTPEKDAASELHYVATWSRVLHLSDLQKLPNPPPPPPPTQPASLNQADSRERCS
ncbi:hypothetical protein RRG08_026673 [Elysia crispata]|uniref:Uncharacterized protein n=1 Tax=Elysia crispata TaxID=231223 RepID=A0AAE1AYG2_9GAST|nr:hypothetical protein RRG08_026673 [Elysia crispata]